MSLLNRPLPAFNAVANGTTATCDLNKGRAYHVVWLQIGDANGITLASGNLIKDIRVLVNEKPQRFCTAVQMNAIQASNGANYGIKTYGVAGTAAYRTLFPIWFAEPWRKIPGQVEGTAWHANGIDNLQIQVDFLNVTTPVLSGWCEYAPSNQPLGAITKYLRQTYNATGDTVEVTNLARQDLYQGLYFFPTSDGKFVQTMQFVKDGDFYREAISYQQNQAMLIGRDMNPDLSATPRFDLVFDYDDPLQSWLVGAQSRDLSFKATLNAAAAGTMDIVSVRAGGLQ